MSTTIHFVADTLELVRYFVLTPKAVMVIVISSMMLAYVVPFFK